MQEAIGSAEVADEHADVLSGAQVAAADVRIKTLRYAQGEAGVA